MIASTALVARREIDPVEIEIFADLLNRISRFRSLANHAYGGMSGFALDDQKALYRTLGLRHMLSFDERLEVVNRQRFNRPTMLHRVTNATVREFASEWPQKFVDEGIEDADGHILWIRSDGSAEVGRSVRDFQQMVGSLGRYGIARTTIAVDYNDWAAEPADEAGPRRTADQVRAAVAQRVRDFLSEHLEESDLSRTMDNDGLCDSVACAFGNAASEAVGASTGIVFEPLSVIRYGANPSRITLTGMLIGLEERTALRERVEENGWPFASSRWSEVRDVILPDLTGRERLELERAGGDRAWAADKLLFDLDRATGVSGAFDGFCRFHRYLPSAA